MRVVCLSLFDARVSITIKTSSDIEVEGSVFIAIIKSVYQMLMSKTSRYPALYLSSAPLENITGYQILLRLTST